MRTNSSTENNEYFIDPESGAEMARLLDQSRLVTQGMGGLLVDATDISNVTHILDLGCGPGGWVHEMAFTYPEAHVEGIDISTAMIQYARAHAQVQGLENADFQVMDITRPLDFPDASFDLINGRMIGFLSTTAWPRLMSECSRITQPGGCIQLTEFESPGTTTSAGLEQLIEMLARALKVTGQNFSPGGRRIGITPMLSRGLLDAGYHDITQTAHVIDYSAGTDMHEGFCQDWQAAFKLVEPFLIHTGVATREEFDRAYEQMLTDMASDNFCAVMFLLTVTGRKPQA